MAEPGAGEHQPTSPETTEPQRSLREKTANFFKRHQALKLIGTGGVIGGIGNAIITQNPVSGLESTAIILGIAAVIDVIDLKMNKKWGEPGSSNKSPKIK